MQPKQKKPYTHTRTRTHLYREIPEKVSKGCRAKELRAWESFLNVFARIIYIILPGQIVERQKDGRTHCYFPIPFTILCKWALLLSLFNPPAGNGLRRACERASMLWAPVRALAPSTVRIINPCRSLIVFGLSSVVRRLSSVVWFFLLLWVFNDFPNFTFVSFCV